MSHLADDPSLDNVPPDFGQALGNLKRPLEENDAVQSDLGPQSRHHDSRQRKMYEVRLDAAPVPRNRVFIPGSIELASQSNGVLDNHQEIEVRAFRGLPARPGTECGNPDQPLAEKRRRATNGVGRAFQGSQVANRRREFSNAIVVQGNARARRRLPKGAMESRRQAQQEPARGPWPLDIIHILYDIITANRPL